MLLGTLGARLSREINRAGEVVVRAGYGHRTWDSSKNKKNGLLMLPHPLKNFDIQKYFQSEPRFNGVYSRDNLPNIKDGAYVTDLDEYSNIESH